MITQPPVNTTAALGTNATFSCHAKGEVFWEVSGTQIVEANKMSSFATVGVYAPLPMNDFSELIVTATRDNNVTRKIKCIVSLGLVMTNGSEAVRLLVYGE